MKDWPNDRISFLVSIRSLLAALVALALAFAPGAAMAAQDGAPRDHQMQMMESGHCEPGVAGTGDHGKMAGKSCCAAMCVAVAIAAAGSVKDEFLPSAPGTFAVPASLFGAPAELATPPPRLA